MASFLKYSDLRLRTQPLVTLPSSSSPTLSHKFHRKETKTDDRTKRREDTVELATHSKIIIFNYFGKEMSFPTASFFWPLSPLPNLLIFTAIHSSIYFLDFVFSFHIRSTRKCGSRAHNTQRHSPKNVLATYTFNIM